MSTNKTFAAATIAAALVLGTGVVAMAADATPTPTTSASTAADPDPGAYPHGQAGRTPGQAGCACKVQGRHGGMAGPEDRLRCGR